MADSVDGERSAEEDRIDRAPDDDAGAATLGRFRFQAELAARFVLAKLAGEPIDRIFCELHEDYVVVFSDGRLPCLVSVKHLESSQPRWTLHALGQDGGVAHLYSRWRAIGRGSVLPPSDQFWAAWRGGERRRVSRSVRPN